MISRSKKWRQADKTQQDSLVVELLNLGADPNHLGGLERSPIQEAAEYCAEDIVARLVDAGADAGAAHGGPSALEIGIRRVQLLTTGGPMEHHGASPYFSGAGIIRRLIEAGVEGKVLRAFRAFRDLFDQLLEFFVKNLKCTPIQSSRLPRSTSPTWRHQQICGFVSKQGVFPGAAIETIFSRLDEDVAHDPPRLYGDVLQISTEANDTELIRLLLQKGFRSLDSSANLLGKALVAASRYGYLDSARILLDAGAEPGHVEPDGRTALECGVTNQHAVIVELLLQHDHFSERALIRQTRDAYTIVERNEYRTGQCSSTCGDFKVVEAQRPFGPRHLLYIAARYGDVNIMIHLLQAGTDCTVAVKDTQDEPQPLLAACESGSI